MPAIILAWPKDKRRTSSNHSAARRVTQTCWRRRGDSNPRDPFEPNGFQDRRFQPLTHPSVFDFNPLRRLEGHLYPWERSPPESKRAQRQTREVWILSYRTGYKRFCNTSAIPRGAYLLEFIEGSAESFIHLAPCYIRAIACSCEPLTRRKPHRSIAFTGRNSCLRACRKRGLS